MKTREIIFRGQKFDTKEWVYGDAITSPKTKSVECIITIDGIPRKFIEVVPGTVGQFIGCLDRNGRQIFENDLMQHINPFDKPFIVNYDNDYSAFVFNEGNTGYSINDRSFEVVGNIFDNPELL